MKQRLWKGSNQRERVKGISTYIAIEGYNKSCIEVKNMILYIILWIVNMWYILQGKDNKVISFFSYLFFGVLFISNAGRTGDAAIYKAYFENQWFPEGAFEFGYTLLERTVFYCGIHTYTGFLIVIFLLGTLFLRVGLKKIDISYHYILAIAMPFIFPTYAVAIRFFLASTMVVASICFLMEKKYLSFFILVFLAGSFHTSSLFYGILILCISRIGSAIGECKKIVLWVISIFSMINFAGALILKRNLVTSLAISVANVMSGALGDKLSAYTSTTTNLGGLIFVLIYLSCLVTAIMTREMIKKEYGTALSGNKSSAFVQKYSVVNYNINLVLSILLSLIAMNLLFYRLIIIGSLSNAIALGLYAWQHKGESRRGIVRICPVKLCYLVSCLLWFVPEIFKINDITIRGLFDASVFFK